MTNALNLVAMETLLLFPCLTHFVNVAHTSLDRLACLHLITPQVEQLVPKLVLTAVRNDEAVVRLVSALALDRLRVIDRVGDRRLVHENLLAVHVFEREALVDRGLVGKRTPLVLTVEQVGSLDDEHVAFPMPRRITRTARQPLLGRNLAVADVDAARFVIDLVNDRELIAL